jgi:hypothetical protein
MNYKLILIKELFNNGELILADGKVIHRDPDTGVETVVAQDTGESNALPKEIAIMHGFDTELNQNGARRSTYADKIINELRASDKRGERKAADFLPKWFVFEDELNNPAPGTPDRVNLDKNDDQGFAGAMVGRETIPFQTKDGSPALDHIYIYLGDNQDDAVKKLSRFKDIFDESVRKAVEMASNNKRI